MFLSALLLSQLHLSQRDEHFITLFFSSKYVVMHMWIYITFCLSLAAPENNKSQKPFKVALKKKYTELQYQSC